MERSTPESQGISSSALLAFLEEAEQELDALHSVMVARNGRVVLEGWWNPYAPTLNHWLFSLSKGFTATGVGIAIAEGRLSLDDAVISFFPEEAPKTPSANLKAMTVRELLKMTHGHRGSSDDVMRAESRDWTRTWLAKDVEHEPGTHWAYGNSASYVLSAIVQKATGETFLDYMKPRFFDPLGIANPVWDQSPEGVCLGGSGLRVTTEDILRFGQVYLQRGVWEGSQILPESWVAEATSLQAATPPQDSIRGWGYNFIVHPDHEAFGSGGRFGQNCYIMPKTNSVIVITAGVRPGSQMQEINDLVWKHLPRAMGESPLPLDRATSADLAKKLGSLSLQVPDGGSEPSSGASVTGRSYLFPANDRGLRSLELETAPDGTKLTLTNGDGSHQIICGYEEWTAGWTSFEAPALVGLGLAHDGSEVPCAACGAWTDDTYSAKLCYTETPFIESLTLEFEGNRVTFNQIANVSLEHWSAKPRAQLVGTAS